MNQHSGGEAVAVVTVAGRRYAWSELDPTLLGAPHDVAHSGLAMASDDVLLTFSTSTQSVIRIDLAGGLVTAVPAPVVCAHGITATSVGRDASLWLADTGSSAGLVDGSIVRAPGTGRVVELDAAGHVRRELEPPLDRRYGGGARYVPTSVAVDPTRQDSDIWVADGYGQSLVHRYSADGRYLSTIDGTSGSGQFDCPHALFWDRRATEARILVADRGGGRVQVFDTQGAFIRSFGKSYLRAPSGFAVLNDYLVVADLHARLTIIGVGDELVAHVGDGEPVWTEPGWPNSQSDGRVVPRTTPRGIFSSPHAVAVGSDGSVYVNEWRLGSRLIRLTPLEDARVASNSHSGARYHVTTLVNNFDRILGVEETHARPGLGIVLAAATLCVLVLVLVALLADPYSQWHVWAAP